MTTRFIKDLAKFAILFLLIGAIFYGGGFYFSLAQESSSSSNGGQIVDKEAYRQELLKQIEEFKNQIKDYEDQIDEKKKEQKTFSREMSIIDGQIKKQELEIKKTNLHLNQLKLDISDKNVKISDFESKARLEKIKLTEHLSKISEYDKVGLLEMILQYEDLSEFFTNVTAVENLQSETYDIILEIRGIKQDLTGQIEAMEEDQSEALELKSMLELQKFSSDQKKKEKKNLIAATKGQEKKFQELIKQNQKKISDIQSRLFEFGNLGVGKITIEKAVEYAQIAGNRAGIRPSFLLGLIWVESKLNSNLGSGNWKTDLYDCYNRLGKTKTAEAQKAAFFDITYKLSLNPDKAPVSKAYLAHGCGGAMGIAQFMPTTWAAYESRIANLTGHNPPSPWGVLDGFTGAAIKLADNGAVSKDRAGERRAAAMYYAGGNWKKAPGQGYADRVRTAAACYQDYMDALKRGDKNINIDSDCEKYF